jgi:hypothetical protein
MFDIHQAAFDTDGDWDDDRAGEYCDGLMTAFAESPEGSAFTEHYGQLGWAHTFLDFGLSYVSSTPPEMSARDVEEIVFGIFPRKVSVEAEAAGEIIAELRAFWEFLGRQYELPNAPGILKELDRDAETELKRELSDPRNFGMAKSFVMMGQKAGYDMTSEAGMQQFMVAYNRGMLAGQGGLSDEPTPALGSLFTGQNPAGLSFNVTPEDRRQRKKQRRKQKRSKSKRGRR